MAYVLHFGQYETDDLVVCSDASYLNPKASNDNSSAHERANVVWPDPVVGFVLQISCGVRCGTKCCDGDGREDARKRPGKGSFFDRIARGEKCRVQSIGFYDFSAPTIGANEIGDADGVYEHGDKDSSDAYPEMPCHTPLLGKKNGPQVIPSFL